MKNVNNGNISIVEGVFNIWIFTEIHRYLLQLKYFLSILFLFIFMVVMKWWDKKDVSVISTCHDVSFQEVQPKNRPKKMKPTIVLDYNNTIGGVDRPDQQMGSYSLMRSQQKKI